MVCTVIRFVVEGLPLLTPYGGRKGGFHVFSNFFKLFAKNVNGKQVVQWKKPINMDENIFIQKCGKHYSKSKISTGNNGGHSVLRRWRVYTGLQDDEGMETRCGGWRQDLPKTEISDDDVNEGELMRKRRRNMEVLTIMNVAHAVGTSIAVCTSIWK